MALAVDRIFGEHRKVHFWADDDAQKQVINAIDDYLFDVIRGEYGVELSLESMDELIRKTMTVARHRNGS